MVRFSAKTDYALRAMLDLTMHPGARTTFPAIAERQGIPRKFLPTVLQSLIQAGLVRTIRGYGGGVELACDPKQITVRQVIESVEGRQQLYDCDSHNMDCVNKTDCRLRNLLIKAGTAMLDVLEQTTLSELVPPGCIASTAEAVLSASE